MRKELRRLKYAHGEHDSKSCDGGLYGEDSDNVMTEVMYESSGKIQDVKTRHGQSKIIKEQEDRYERRKL